ncbi:MAG: hypothetical protein WCS37_10705, partial [Chloroflexota bacterium]
GRGLLKPVYINPPLNWARPAGMQYARRGLLKPVYINPRYIGHWAYVPHIGRMQYAPTQNKYVTSRDTAGCVPIGLLSEIFLLNC